jgi:hypothetical protein
MDPTSGPDNDTTKTPSPPEVPSKSTDTSPSKTKLTDSGPHRATSGPTLQGRPSYASIARKALSAERLDSAAGASPATASSPPSRRREPRPTDSRATAVPATVSRGRHATAQRKGISEFDVELDARSRARPPVSPRVVLPLVILTNDRPLQPPADVDNTRNVVAPHISKSSDISVSKEARAAQRSFDKSWSHLVDEFHATD